MIFVNSQGITIGPSAEVQVGGLIASTHDIRNEDFLAGRFNFGSVNESLAEIVNKGTIVTKDGGFAILIASAIDNAAGRRKRLNTGIRLFCLSELDGDVPDRVWSDGYFSPSTFSSFVTLEAPGTCARAYARRSPE